MAITSKLMAINVFILNTLTIIFFLYISVAIKLKIYASFMAINFHMCVLMAISFKLMAINTVT